MWFMLIKSITLYNVVNSNLAWSPFVRTLVPSALMMSAMRIPACVCFLRTITSNEFVNNAAIIPLAIDALST